ncbi:MAG: hypothetical protein ACRDLS_03090 [Solirubrobacteraceae bacterium]
MAALLGLAAFAASASAAAVSVNVGCVIFGGTYSDPAIPVLGAGFTPNSSVTLSTFTAQKPTPAFLGSAQVDAAGNFGTVTGAAIFNSSDTRKQTFNLVASDGTIAAVTTFTQVRAGYHRAPDPKRPNQKVKHVAQGFTTGKRVWAHFRHGGKTRANKSLGKAKGPCGIATKRMRALPTKSRLGTWKVYVDEKKRFSLSTRPQARLTFTVFQRYF